jgi:hypothetical protein
MNRASFQQSNFLGGGKAFWCLSSYVFESSYVLHDEMLIKLRPLLERNLRPTEQFLEVLSAYMWGFFQELELALLYHDVAQSSVLSG